MTAIVTAVVFGAVLAIATGLRPADENPCYRSCELATPMTCIYNFTLSTYFTLSRPRCGRCPHNQSDCGNFGCVPADGVKRVVSLVNLVFPAPSIQICSGDEVVVNVTNNMMNGEGTTIHWHGLYQDGSQFMDGVPMVTQCPIPSPGNFQYRFTSYQPGTHWYHTHTGLQRSDGLMGTLVVRESKRTDPSGDLYDHDLAEHVIFLNEWYYRPMTDFIARVKWGIPPLVDSILINGKGISPSTSPPRPPLEVFNVEQGQRYRFRVINGASGDCTMQISVQNHSLLVIASDGVSFQPQQVDYFRISAGERFDFVLNANQSIDNYLIEVIGLPCTNTLGGATKQIAHLHYDGASEPPAVDELPNIESFGDEATWWQTFPDKSIAEVNSTNVHHWSTDGAENHQEYMEIKYFQYFNPTTNVVEYIPQINGISFHLPTSPLMSQYDDLPPNIFCNRADLGPGKCEGGNSCSCVHTIDVDANEKIEIIMVNPDSDVRILHPMHLHGLAFKVVAMDTIEGVTVELVRELLANGSIVRNNNGPMKDTVNIPILGYTIVQFQGWNPGWWLFHCHLEFHFEEGMGLLFNVHGDLPPVPDSFPTCGVWPPRPRVLGTEEPAPKPCQDPPTDTFPLLHLAWIIPLTFVLALVIGVLTGRRLVGSGHPAAVGGGATPASTASPIDKATA